MLAYICGHTHNRSATQIDGVWQLDGGHARGAGDIGAPSTLLVIHVDDATARFEAYRDEHDGLYNYMDITHRGKLAPLYRAFLPLAGRRTSKGSWLTAVGNDRGPLY